MTHKKNDVATLRSGHLCLLLYIDIDILFQGPATLRCYAMKHLVISKFFFLHYFGCLLIRGGIKIEQVLCSHLGPRFSKT